MNFMGLLKSVGSAILKDAQRKTERMNDTEYNASRWDDETLIKRFKNASGPEKMGYAKELKNRGYGKK